MQQFEFTWRESLDFQIDRVRRHLRADVFDSLAAAGYEPQIGLFSEHLDSSISEAFDSCRAILDGHQSERERRKQAKGLTCPPLRRKDAA